MTYEALYKRMFIYIFWFENGKSFSHDFPLMEEFSISVVYY